MSQPPENQQQYGSILTLLGENAEQNGKLKNKQITFTHVAIGDANDTYVQPDRKQTALVNELARIPVNSVDVLQPTPDSTPMLKVEAILPDDVNDLIIREFAAVATFDGNTYFHAVGNCARIYVPAPVNNGNVSTPVTLEMIFVITSAEPIVEIDPNVITASRAFVHKQINHSDERLAQTVIDQNGKDWFIDDGFLVIPQFDAFNIKSGYGYVSGTRVNLEFDRNIQVPYEPAFIYVDAWREGSSGGEWETNFNFVVSADELDDYKDESTSPATPHFVCKIAKILVDGTVEDLRLDAKTATKVYVDKISSHRQMLISGGSKQLDLTSGVWGQLADDVDRVLFDNETYWFAFDNPRGVVTRFVDNKDYGTATMTCLVEGREENFEFVKEHIRNLRGYANFPTAKPERVFVEGWGAKSGDSTYDSTAAVQAAVDTLDLVSLVGDYWVDSIILKPAMKGIIGTSSGFARIYQREGAKDDLFRWNGKDRITRLRMEGFYCFGNGVSGRNGLNLSGISYSQFIDLQFYNFPADGIFMDGNVTGEISQQVSNNYFQNVRTLNNGRDGVFFHDSNASGDANSANTFISCEFSRNGRHGVNYKDGTANNFYGCTSQGNGDKNLYLNGRYFDWVGYIEPAPFSVVFDTDSYGCNVRTRSSYPLWSSFVDVGDRNTFSVYGEDSQSRHVFKNSALRDWVGEVPHGVEKIGNLKITPSDDNESESGVNMRVEFTENECGILISLDENASNLSKEWVTVSIDWNPAISEDNRITIRTQVDGVDNTKTGENVLSEYPVFHGFKKSFYDVRFAENNGSLAKIKILFSTDAAATINQFIDIRSLCVYTGQTMIMPPIKVHQESSSANSEQLSSIKSGINLVGKKLGKIIANKTDGKLYYAVGTLAGSEWRAVDGVGVIQPN